MSVTVYAVLGFTMMLVLTAVLVSGKFTPSIPMIVIPIVFAMIMRPTLADLSDWVTAGLKGQVSNAAMFTFAIIFFGVMNCLPWGGPCGRLAAGFGVSATEIMIAELPGMIIGLICCFLIALYYAAQEKKRGAGFSAEERMVVYGRFERTEIYC